VTGVIQPTDRIGDLAREHDAFFLIDAAQTAGQLPINVESLQTDLLAAPGHKGLLGPLGSGILYVGPRAEEQLIPMRQGGTGSESESDRQPEALPERMEAGNLNVPGIVGLAAGVEYLLEKDVSAIRTHHLALRELLCSGLEKMQNITLYGPMSQECVGVVSFSISGYAPQEVAAMLDSAYGIQVRAGYHCAADIHDTIGSRETGGTVRISLGPFNDEVQIAQVLKAVGQIATEAPI
jgi:selenocysteine lyase/cysteine desulfurase